MLPYLREKNENLETLEVLIQTEMSSCCLYLLLVVGACILHFHVDVHMLGCVYFRSILGEDSKGFYVGRKNRVGGVHTFSSVCCSSSRVIRRPASACVVGALATSSKLVYAAASSPALLALCTMALTCGMMISFGNSSRSTSSRRTTGMGVVFRRTCSATSLGHSRRCYARARKKGWR